MDLDARLGTEAAAYARAVSERVHHELGDDLVGVWLFGSGALGGFDPARSDLDIQAVSEPELPRARRLALAEALNHRALRCPVRGLEFVLYSRAGLTAPGGPAFELNLNTGPRMQPHLALDSQDDPRFWFVIDVAIGREHGVALAGPPPADVFPLLPRPLVVEALGEAVSWYRGEGAHAEAAAAARRADAFRRDGIWLSKKAVSAPPATTSSATLSGR